MGIPDLKDLTPILYPIVALILAILVYKIRKRVARHELVPGLDIYLAKIPPDGELRLYMVNSGRKNIKKIELQKSKYISHNTIIFRGVLEPGISSRKYYTIQNGLLVTPLDLDFGVNLRIPIKVKYDTDDDHGISDKINYK